MAKETKTPEENLEEVEKAVEEQPEVKDLTEADVDIGLPPADILALVARERYNIAVAFTQLKVRKSAVSASIAANRGTGNTDGVKKFEEQEKALSMDLQHCLRGIKAIDKEYTGARKRMQEMIKTPEG